MQPSPRTRPSTNTASLGILAWGICATAAIFYCYEYYLRITPAVMTTELMHAYRTDAESLGNLTAYYYYAYTPMQLLVGFLLDRFSVRLLIAGACFACAVGSYLFAATTSLAVAEFGRLLVGLGSAFAFVGVLKLATIWLPPNRFAFVSGLTTTLGSIGGMTGIIFLSNIVTYFGWRQTMFGAAIIGVLLSFALFALIRNRPPHCRHHESYFSPLPQNSQTITFRQLLLEIGRLFANRAIWINGIIGGILYLPSSAFAELWGLPFLQHVYHLSQADASYGISLLFLGYAIGCPIAGLASDLLRRRKIVLLASAILTTLMISLIVFYPELLLTKFTLYLALFAFGLAYSGQVIIFSVACDISPSNCAGSAIAITNMFTMIGGLVFQPLIGYFLDKAWRGGMLDGVRSYSAANYQHALVILPLTIGASILLGLWLKETCDKGPVVQA